MAEKQLEFEKAVRAVQASNKFRRGSFHPVSFSDASESADSDQEKYQNKLIKILIHYNYSYDRGYV